ncbi:uncharacterized protein DFL_005580 [Arthrobotrys flagrans]|uniref:DUF4246 domain-containing protein n=1 Tax=Arthrobotrys flagrans TaxID=97331 RepID=A0A436ZYI6_ARTFL|nr:hypothetical protein DFL_005580 [Arthrobotrys flagrans]
MWHPPTITDETNLHWKMVKVIVEMTKILLTPENPVHHLGRQQAATCRSHEGSKNERIVAMGIYYYAQENIAETTIAFVRKINTKDYNLFLSIHSNFNYRDQSFQRTGETPIKQNRLIAFPNIYAHSTTLRLKDLKRPGYQKTLTFFLCGPNNHDIPTTKIIAPQQPHHRIEVEKALREGIWGNLPNEIFELILKHLPPPISVEEAYGYRAALLRKRD